ncbi:OCIA domain-containing protein 1-like isoform X1 [Tachysurus vachellii]|uniref:OCIA domain-containing protein 1-like isoform X1 n=1 Tax=Tachysurus vachellii TaxID=175792 RepID=UPI00296B14D9|nr:OCIA domain-containing protein 1-like isoform X1 [Tachysurus vachellii]
MSESSSERRAETQPAAVGAEYTPTDEERKVFKQCDTESFWYRSVPFSASTMALTHMLITHGKLTSSPRFGSLPKVLFAGMCGYFAGKLSYVKTCQNKFYNLENSPIGEALRQRHRHQRPPQLAGPQSELREDDKPQFEVFQSESVSEAPYSPPDYSHTTPSAQQHDLHIHALRDEEDEQEVKSKPIFYEELRNKNRENYDITRTQKIDRDVLKKEGESLKKNKYGDMWEEE